MLAQYFHSMTDEQEALDALAHVGLKDRARICLRNSPAESSSGCASRAP